MQTGFPPFRSTRHWGGIHLAVAPMTSTDRHTLVTTVGASPPPAMWRVYVRFTSVAETRRWSACVGSPNHAPLGRYVRFL